MERDLASTPAPPSAFRTHGALTEVIAEEVLVPRQQWQPLVLRKHPDVLELRERLRGVTGQASFGRFINAARTEVKETLSHHNMLQLLYLFLQEEGMNDTLKSLQQESGVPFCNSEGFPEGAMTGLLRLSVKDPKRLFEDTENEGEDDDAEVVVYDYVPAASFNNEAERDEDKGLESESGLSGLVLDPGTKEVMFGKLNSLIAWLTSASNPDLNFRRIFLLTYQSFTTPETLLHKLIQRYHAVDMLGGEERKQIHQRIFTVTKYWIQQHGADWGEKLISNLNSFIDNILVTDGYTGMAKQLRNALAKMESKPEKQDVSVSYVTIPDPKVPKNIFSPSLTLDDVDEEEIARQLTLIEYEYYSAINSPELLRKRWSDSDSPEWGPNVTALLKRYNDVSRWVSTSILDVPKLKHRAKVLSRFIRIADHLRRQSNFGSLAAVFAGINNSAVHRLRSTRRELPREQQKTLEEMERLMSAENSYANYRAAYRKARPPSIPFAGVHLRDLALVEEASRMDDEEGKDDVDFVRCKCVWGIIVDVLRFQPVPFNFHHVHQIASFLRTFAAKEISDEEMFLLSFTAEPSVV